MGTRWARDQLDLATLAVRTTLQLFKKSPYPIVYAPYGTGTHKLARMLVNYNMVCNYVIIEPSQIMM